MSGPGDLACGLGGQRDEDEHLAELKPRRCMAMTTACEVGHCAVQEQDGRDHLLEVADARQQLLARASED
jgi:hypothetical protein